ncbi:MAG: hypothetical protein JWO63_1352 [Frankiales bacterium]|nr:hypothetical protein [Frankiales bacterium]
MWVLLSRRLRMWAAAAILLPVSRAVLHRIAERQARRRPDTLRAKGLRRADQALARRTRGSR